LVKRNITLCAPGLVLAAHGAAAMELDTLIPAGLPGLGTAPPLSVIGSARAGDAALPIRLGEFSIAPTLTAGAGYDTAPNGSAGAAATLTLAQSFVVTDAPLGFGAVLSGNTSVLPSDPRQDVSGYTAAAGEEAVLPRETVSFVAGYARRAATGFSLSGIAAAKPQSYGVLGVSARDKISAGMFTLTPQISYAVTSFDGAPAENVAQTGGRFELDVAPGGSTRIVILIEATSQKFRTASLDAASYAALAGLDEDATGLWDVRLLAGAAWRRPRRGAAITAPVLEAAATWAPTELDIVSLTAAHEIDDPDQISPDGYMLTQGNLSWTHEAGHDIDLSAAMQASHAAFFSARRNETLAAAGAALAWHVSGALALDAAYQFNDRQADFLRAANEQIVTLNAVWTP
jgi:hypothetical protein